MGSSHYIDVRPAVEAVPTLANIGKKPLHFIND